MPSAPCNAKNFRYAEEFQTRIIVVSAALIEREISFCWLALLE
jgi:hypothetical protein